MPIIALQNKSQFQIDPLKILVKLSRVFIRKTVNVKRDLN